MTYSNLSKEIGVLHDWPGRLWARRYRAIQVSDEEEDQVARLKYILGAGVKEHLVDRAIEWPGVHSVRALLKNQPLQGWWFDRSREFAARRRGERPNRYDHAREQTVVLDPLPCWRHLPANEVKRRVKAVVREIEVEAATERHETGKTSLGAEAVMATDPHHRPAKLDPLRHLTSRRKAVRKAMREDPWSVARSRLAGR